MDQIEEKPAAYWANGNSLAESPVLKQTNDQSTRESRLHYLTEVEQDIWSIKINY